MCAMGKTDKSVFRFFGKTALIVCRGFTKAQLPDLCKMPVSGHSDLSSSSHLLASMITSNQYLVLLLPVNSTVFMDWRGGKAFKLNHRERSLWDYSTVIKILGFHDFVLFKQNKGNALFNSSIP